MSTQENACNYEPHSFSIKLPDDKEFVEMLKRCGMRRIYPQLIENSVDPREPLLIRNEEGLPPGLALFKRFMDKHYGKDQV